MLKGILAFESIVAREARHKGRMSGFRRISESTERRFDAPSGRRRARPSAPPEPAGSGSGTATFLGSVGWLCADVWVQPGSRFDLRSFGLMCLPGSDGAKFLESVQSACELAVEAHLVFVHVGVGLAEG